MDPILQTLLSWQFLVFGIAVASFMFVLRRTVEYILANCQVAAKESKLWNDLLLPILPVLVGVGGALTFKSYPYPDGLTTTGDRFIFGLVAGLLSTLFYRVIKAMLIQKITGVPVQTTTTITPGNPEAPVDPEADVSDLANQVRQSINK